MVSHPARSATVWATFSTDGGELSDQVLAAMLTQRPSAQAERAHAERDVAEAEQSAYVAEVLAQTIRDWGGFVDEYGEPYEPDWPSLLPRLVDAIWVEDDGSITLEGTAGVPGVSVHAAQQR